MLMATCMTAADLCSMYKPWDLQVQLVHVIMEEFWQQVSSCAIGHLSTAYRELTDISKD